MSKMHIFTQDEDDFIRENYLKFSRVEISKKMNISVYKINRRYRDLKLVIPHEIKASFSLRCLGRKYRPFTAKEDKFIRENFDKIPTKRIATMINRSGCGVRNRIKFLGLEIPPDVKQKFITDSHIKKGAIPPNKGKKLPPEILAKMQRTMFKKGNIPANAVPLGTEHVISDGYVEVKVKESSGKANWALKHHVIWRKHFGEIPPGMCVYFKDGNKQNFAIDNLGLITKADALEKNMYQPRALAKRFLRVTDEEVTYLETKNPELMKLVSLHYNLKKKINQNQQ